MMKLINRKYFTVATLLLLSFTNYTFAEAQLPTSKQTSSNNTGNEIEIVDEITIEDVSSTPSNPKLKQGDACSDEKLEEAKGKLMTITHIPMAKTEPCEKVGCQDLKPAKMRKIIIKKLPPMAKTISCEKK